MRKASFCLVTCLCVLLGIMLGTVLAYRHFCSIPTQFRANCEFEILAAPDYEASSSESLSSQNYTDYILAPEVKREAVRQATAAGENELVTTLNRPDNPKASRALGTQRYSITVTSEDPHLAAVGAMAIVASFQSVQNGFAVKVLDMPEVGGFSGPYIMPYIGVGAALGLLLGMLPSSLLLIVLNVVRKRAQTRQLNEQRAAN